MPIRVKVDGLPSVLVFDDGTPESVISNVVRQESQAFASQAKPAEQPSAPPPDDTLAQQVGFVTKAIGTGIDTALRAGDIIAETTAGPDVPSGRQQRRAFEQSMADPRRLAPRITPDGQFDFGRQSPGSLLYGPSAKLEEIRRPQVTAREARQFDIAQASEKLASRPQSQTMQQWAQIKDGDLPAIFSAIAKNPVELIATITAESLPSSLVGLPAGPTGIGVASGLTDLASGIVDGAARKGYDFRDARQVGAFFQNPTAFREVVDEAGKHATIVGGADMLTARLAGVFLKPALGKGVARVAAGTGAELAMQMGGGAGGEALGSVAAGQPVSAKNMVAEAIGELSGAPAETVSNLREELTNRQVEKRQALADTMRVEVKPVEGGDLVLPTAEGSPAEGSFIDSTDWANVGRLDLQATPAAGQPEAAQRVRTAASSLGLAEPDIRWAPDLRTDEGNVVESWVDPESGQIVVNSAAPVFENPTTAAAVLREEAAHQLLRSAEAAAVIRGFADEQMTDTQRAALEQSGYVRPKGMSDLDYRAYLANEWIAKSAREQQSWWQDLVERTKTWLSNLSGGKLVSLTNEEVARSILRSLRSRPSQGSPATAPIQFSLSPPEPPPGQKLRRFIGQVDLDSGTSNAVRGYIGPAAYYTPRENEPDSTAADRMMQEMGGPEAVSQQWGNLPKGTPEAVQGFIAQQVIKQLGVAEQAAALTNPAESDRLARVAAEFSTRLGEQTTAYGQFIQSFARFRDLSPMGWVHSFRLLTDKVGENIHGRLDGPLKRIGKKLRKLNKDGLTELTADPAAQSATGEAVSEKVKQGKTVRQAIRRQAVGKAGKQPRVHGWVRKVVMHTLDLAGPRTSPTLWGRYVAEAASQLAHLPGEAKTPEPTILAPFTADVARTLRETIDRMFPAPEATETQNKLTALQRLTSILSNPEKSQEVWAATIAALREAYPDDPRVDALANQPAELFSKSLIGEVVRDTLRQAELSLRELVANHYQLLGEGWTLAQRIAKESGLPLAVAQELAEHVDTAVRQEVKTLEDQLAARITRAKAAQRSRLKRAAGSGLVDLEALPVDELDLAIRQELTAARTSIGKVLSQHYSTFAPTGRTLAEAFVADAGLAPDVAAKLADKLQARFRSLLAERRRRIIMREAAAVPRKYAAKLPIDRIMELANLGLLGDREVWDKVRDSLGLPAHSPEIEAAIVKRVNALSQLPEGVRRDTAIKELQRYMASQQNALTWDLPMSLWFANLLSGPTTHAVNLLSNWMQVVAHTTTAVMRDPGIAPALLDSLPQGFAQGLSHGGHALQTGVAVGRRMSLKSESAGSLEGLGQDARWKRILSKWKYVSRLLAAEDLLAYKSAEQIRLTVLARAIAKDEGLTGEALARRTREIAFGTEDQQAAARAQVESEGLTGNIARIRYGELIDQTRPASVNDQTHAFALRTVFNSKPYGVLGDVASAIKFLAAKQPLTRLVIPFIDVVANVSNESLNYFPLVGYGRAAVGRYMGKLNGEVLDLGTEGGKADLADQMGKATIGLVAMSTLALAAASGLDSDDPPFAIYGSGPSEKGQKDLLRASGWQPWSIKIGNRYRSYIDTPLALALGTIGSYMDAIRWKKLEDSTLMDRVAIAAMSIPRLVVQRNFLRGLSDLFASLSREATPKSSGSRVVKAIASSASSLVVPNALRQLDQLFDPTSTDPKTASAILVGQVPFMRRLNRPALNPLGNPVRYSPMDRFGTIESTDPLTTALVHRGLWVSVPQQGELTDDEYYQVVKERGELLRPKLIEQMPNLLTMDQEVAQTVVNRITSAYTQSVRAQVLGRRPPASSSASPSRP